MKLYFAPGSCSHAPHIILRECKLQFDTERVDMQTHKMANGSDFYAINPKGYVPVLELDDGQRLTEGPVICQYIADKAKREDLMPAAGSFARYRVMEWQNYITAELHKSFGPLFTPAFDDATKGMFKTGLHKKYGWVNEQLRGKQCLTGDNFTAADAYLYAVTSWAKFVALDLDEYAELQGFLTRVAARPAVQEARKAEGLSK